MSSIPIIGDILDTIQGAISWLIQVSPAYFKAGLFLLMLGFIVSSLLVAFNVLNISHRIFKPADCQMADITLSNYSTDFICYSNDTVKRTLYLTDINLCMVTNSYGTCGACIMRDTHDNRCELRCYSILYGGVTPIITGCEYNVFTPTGGNTTTLLQYCTRQSMTAEFSAALKKVDECKNSGFDFLNYKVLYMAAMVTWLGGFFLSFRASER